MGTLSYMDANGVWQTTEDQGGGVELTDGIIETRYLADDAVTTVKIDDLSVTNPKIVSMDAAKLTGVLDGTLIENGSISHSKLSGGITSGQLDPTLGQFINDTNTIASSKNSVYYQAAMPSGGSYKTGDTWFDIDDGYKIYVWNGSLWNNSQDTSIAAAAGTANAAQSLASGKNTIYYLASQPTAPTSGFVVGDTWFNTAEGNKIYKWSGSAWVAAVLSSSALDAAVNSSLQSANLAVRSTVMEYSVSGSETVAPTTGWSSSTPTRTPGTFVWMRSVVTYGDATTQTTNPVILTGNTGIPGSSGVSVTSVTPYFLQQASSTTPAIPTTSPPGGSWQTTEPAYISNTHLFRVERVVYSDANFSYTPVSLASSYTAASQAMASANGKNTIYYQAEQPSGGTYKSGDLWFDTNDGNKPYVFDGATFVANIDTSSGSPMAIANSKNKVFYQTSQPTGGVYLVGDLWFDSDEQYKQYVYTPTGWVLAQDSYAAQHTADMAAMAANGKNKTIYSASNPSGTGFVDGDTWYKYDGTGIIGFWRYLSNTWTIQTIQNAVFGNIDAGKIVTGILNANLISVNTLNGDRITANTLTASKLVAGTITAASGVIADAAITTAKIADLAVTNAKIGSLDAGKVTTGFLDAARIQAGTITGTMITGNTVTANNMVAGTITAASGIIADAAIVSAKIADLSVTTAKIADLSVTDAKISTLNAGKINAGTIAAARIGAETITADKLYVGDMTNLFSDGNFNDVDKNNWNTNGSIITSTTELNRLEITSIVGNTYTINLNSFQVSEGEQIYASSDIYANNTNSGSGTALVQIRITKTDGTTQDLALSSIAQASASGVWSSVSGTATIPALAKSAVMMLVVNDNVAGDKFSFRNAYASRRFGGELIVDGSVTAQQIKSGTITAQSGIISSINADTITSGTISAERISVIPSTQITGTISKDQLSPDVIEPLNAVAGKAESSTVDSISTSLSTTQTAVTKLSDAIVVSGTGIQNAINISATTGITIKQYDSSGASKFAINLDGDSLDFLESDVVVAKITSRNLLIGSATVTGDIGNGAPGTFVVGAHEFSRLMGADGVMQTVVRWVG